MFVCDCAPHYGAPARVAIAPMNPRRRLGDVEDESAAPPIEFRRPADDAPLLDLSLRAARSARQRLASLLHAYRRRASGLRVRRPHVDTGAGRLVVAIQAVGESETRPRESDRFTLRGLRGEEESSPNGCASPRRLVERLDPKLGSTRLRSPRPATTRASAQAPRSASDRTSGSRTDSSGSTDRARDPGLVHQHGEMRTLRGESFDEVVEQARQEV